MTKKAGFRRALVALAGALALAAPAAAREKLDSIRLTNGDQISCEIVALQSGYVQADTSGFGDVEIERAKIAALVSIQYFEVELADGRRIVATLDEGASPGRIALHIDNAPMIEVPFEEVFQIRQLGSRIWNSAMGRLNIGLSFGSVNHESNYSLDAAVTFSAKRFRWLNGLQETRSDDSSSEVTERTQAYSQLEVPVGRRFALAGRGAWERNSELDLDSRITASGVFLWLPWRSDHGRFGAGLGVAQSEEKYTQGGSHSVTMGVVYLGVEAYRFGPYGTRLVAEASYLPALSGETRHRVELRGTFTQKIASDFNISVSPFYSFDSRTPIEGLENEDWGFISSVGWSF